MAGTRYQAMVFFDKGAPGAMFKVDVIEHAGAFWLVPEWFEYPQEKERSPARIISLLTLQHQDMPPAAAQGFPRFLVSVPVSKDVFDGRIPPDKAAGYIVVDRPDIRLPLPDGLN